jgi:hypothetical protein
MPVDILDHQALEIAKKVSSIVYNFILTHRHHYYYQMKLLKSQQPITRDLI